MVATIRLDGTNLLVFGGVLLIVGAGAWRFIGTYLLWALWQVVLYYLVLIAVASMLYGALVWFVNAGDADAAARRDRDVVDETVVE